LVRGGTERALRRATVECSGGHGKRLAPCPP